MKKTLKRIPLPIVGLMLGLGTIGNLVLSYGENNRKAFGILSGVIFVLVVLKIAAYPKDFINDLNNPVIASVFPTFSMGIMLLSTYIKPIEPSFAYPMWIAGIVIHIILMILFTQKYVLKLKIKQVFPSWFIPYVGIVVASVTAPAFDKTNIGKIAFWFGLITYFLILPIVLKRVFKIKEIPEPARPTIGILAAPVALCLAGYMNSFQEKNILMIWFLLALSQINLIYVLIQIPKLLKGGFYPSYSAFTFPLAISALSIKLVNGFFIKSGNPINILQYMVRFEEVIAIAMVLYVLLKYIEFIFAKAETAK